MGPIKTLFHQCFRVWSFVSLLSKQFHSKIEKYQQSQHSSIKWDGIQLQLFNLNIDKNDLSNNSNANHESEKEIECLKTTNEKKNWTIQQWLLFAVWSSNTNKYNGTIDCWCSVLCACFHLENYTFITFTESFEIARGIFLYYHETNKPHEHRKMYRATPFRHLNERFRAFPSLVRRVVKSYNSQQIYLPDE